MPVRIIRKGEAQPATAAPKPHVVVKRVPAKGVAPTPQPVVAKPVEVPSKPLAGVLPEAGTGVQVVPRGWLVGGGVVLRKHDLSHEDGSTKFLLHRIKDKVWYRVRSFDHDTRLLDLTSQMGMEFQSRLHVTFFANYMVALFPQGTKEPSPEALHFVSRKLPKILEEAAAASVHSSAISQPA